MRSLLSWRKIGPICQCLFIFLLLLGINYHFIGGHGKRKHLTYSNMSQLLADSYTPLPKASYSSIFIYRAYYDDRTVKNTIRILAISKCIKNGTKLEIKINGTTTPLKFEPVEGSCPWSWAKKCLWNAYEFMSVNISSAPEEVEIIVNGTRSLVVPVTRRSPVAKGQLQVCIPPLYWYHDWARLILFFELWKNHNVTFLMYANSVSTSAARIIEHYKAQGIVQLINWPMLPPSADGDDPNAGLYRLSHSLAHNDCALRMAAEFGALVDVDDYLHMSGNLSLVEYAKSRFTKKKTVGSLMFKHHGLHVGNLNGSFDGVKHSKLFDNNRPTKSLFKTDVVRFLSTHWVLKFHPPAMHNERVNATEGKYLHYRSTFDNKVPKKTIKLSEIDFEGVQERAIKFAKVKFGDNMPPERSNASQALEECNQKWVKQGCRVPLLHCRKVIESTDDWAFYPPSKDSHYLML